MVYDDEEEDYFESNYEEGEEIEKESKEEEEDTPFFSNDKNITNDFDMQGFPVHEAVDFYHGKTRKIKNTGLIGNNSIFKL